MNGVTRTEFVWLSEGTTAFAAMASTLAAMIVVLWLYRRESSTMSIVRKRLLAAMRMAALLGAGLMWLGPALIRVDQRHVLPAVVIARDASLSMSVVDPADSRDSYELNDSRASKESRDAKDESASRRRNEMATQSNAASGGGAGATREERRTRAEQVDAALRAGASPWFARLTQRGRPLLLDFAADAPSPRLVETLAPSRADGRGSNLAAAIRAALEGEPPAAVVMLTDGQHTGRDDPADAAREAARRGVPLLVVGVGDPRRPRDVRVAGIYARPRVWKDEPFEVEVLLSYDPTQSSRARVTLQERPGEGEAAATEVESRVVELAADQRQARVVFARRAEHLGRFVFSARIYSLDVESDEAKQAIADPAPTNVSSPSSPKSSATLESLPVEVMDREKLRVLMVAGAPSWDYQMVERLLLRDKSLTVSCWVQSQEPERERAGSRPLEELPSTRESLDWYDVVLLFDPDPDRLPPGWGDLLKAFAQQHAGGVCYMAGPRFASRLLTDAGSQSLRDLLPVKWNGAIDFDAASMTVAQSRAWPLRPVASSSDHPLLRLAAEGRDEPEAWERLPGVFWSFPVGQVKPTARVLLEHGDPTLRAARGGRPLLVLGRYGAAQVAYLGLQGTWRWRRDDDGDSAWGERFWDRMVRQLAEGRSWEGSRRGWLRTDRERYEIGDRIVVTAKLQDAASTPLTVSRVEGEVVVDGSKSPITLAAVPDHPGEFSATWQTRQAGPHQFVVNLEDETGGEPLRLDVTAPVEPPRIESDATWLDRARLQQLAELSGGRYFDLEHLDQVLEAVPDRSETVEVRHPPQPLWDHVWTLLGFVAVLGAEWFLRQRWR